MDRNLAGETSYRFSPTLTEAASFELNNLQERIDTLYIDATNRDHRIDDLERKNTEAITEITDKFRNDLYENSKSTYSDIRSLKCSVDTLSDVLFRVLIRLPIRILNWFMCFASLNISQVAESGKRHLVTIILHPMNMSPNIDKKTIRELNKISYETLCKIKKSEKNPRFKVTLTVF